MANRAHKSGARLKPKPIHKSEHKHYWPYIPMLVMVLAIFAVSLFQPVTHRNVLSYATEMSSSSLLSATNNQRHENDVATLRLNSSLSQAAQTKANDMVKRDYWSHNTPDGDEPWVFIQAVGYSYQKAGENLAYGFTTSSGTVSGWMNSPSHRENLLDSSFSEVGFGFANSTDFNNSGPETVVVAMYAKPTVKAAASSAPPASSVPTPKQNQQPTTVKTLPKTLVRTASKPDSTKPIAQGFSTDHAGLEPVTLAVSRVQTITNGDLPWALFAAGLLTGLCVAILLIKHAVALRHLFKNSERLILHHPLLDTAILSLILIGTFLMQTSGYIK